MKTFTYNPKDDMVEMFGREERKTLTTKLTRADREKRTIDLAERAVAVADELMAAKARLTKAKDAKKGVDADQETLNRDIFNNTSQVTGMVKIYLDHRTKQCLEVRDDKGHKGEIWLERTQNEKEMASLFAKRAAEAGEPKPAFQEIVAACIDEAMVDRPEGRLVTELVKHLTVEKGLKGITPEMVRDILAGDNRYTLDTGDVVTVGPVDGAEKLAQEVAAAVKEVLSPETLVEVAIPVLVTEVARNAEVDVSLVDPDAIRALVGRLAGWKVTDDRAVRHAAPDAEQGDRREDVARVAEVIIAQVVVADGVAVEVAAMVGVVKDATDLEVEEDAIREVVEQVKHLTLSEDGARIVRAPGRHTAVRALHLLRGTDDGKATTAGLRKLWNAHEKKEQDEGKKWGPAPTKQEVKDALAQNADAKKKGLWWHLVKLTPEQEKYLADKKRAESGE